MIDFRMEGLFLLSPSVEIFWDFLCLSGMDLAEAFFGYCLVLVLFAQDKFASVF
jgi:hypothetical protein